MTDTPAKSRRRWLSFSLRTLFVAVTVTVAFGWFVPPVWTIYQRWAFIRKITAAGGSAIPFATTPQGDGAAWGSRAPLRRFLGDELIRSFNLGEAPIDETSFDEASRLFPEATSIGEIFPEEVISDKEMVITLRCPVGRRAPIPEHSQALPEASPAPQAAPP